MSSKYHQSFLASIERNQIPISRLLLTILYALHIVVDAQPITSKFTSLQYSENDPDSGQLVYGIGIDDTYYVINWVITFTFLRSFLMQWVFGPFASYVCAIHSKKAKVRFAEQSWSFVYYTMSFLFGVYLFIGQPYYNNLDNLYLGWPHEHHSAHFKAYYLVQIAFWIQQIFVLNIEQRRKDHYQMFSHHIITCALLIGLYYYHLTKVGHLILMIMDSVDIFLSAAKMLKYSGRSVLCDVMFLFFLVSWIVLRHGVYNVLFMHAWFHAKDLMKDGECVAGVSKSRCWTDTVINLFLGLLGGLQVITIIWMYLILKVAYKVVTGKGAEDVRSDDDDTDVEEESGKEHLMEKEESKSKEHLMEKEEIKSKEHLMEKEEEESDDAKSLDERKM